MASDYQPEHEGCEQIIAPAGVVAPVPLSGPSASPLTIALGANSTIVWSTTDRRAIDIELRARLDAWEWNEGPGGVKQTPIGEPYITWEMVIGHGVASLDEPRRIRLLQPNHIPMVTPYVLPSRGLILRTTARELRLRLNYHGVLPRRLLPPEGPDMEGDPEVSNPLKNVTVRVSFQPVTGVEVPVYPRFDFCSGARGALTLACAFPIGATEWRLRDGNGQPFALGELTDIVLAGNAENCRDNRGPVAVVGDPPNLDRGLFADWQPIPVFAVTWSCGPPTLAGTTYSRVYACAEYR